MENADITKSKKIVFLDDDENIQKRREQKGQEIEPSEKKDVVLESKMIINTKKDTPRDMNGDPAIIWN